MDSRELASGCQLRWGYVIVPHVIVSSPYIENTWIDSGAIHGASSHYVYSVIYGNGNRLASVRRVADGRIWPRGLGS